MKWHGDNPNLAPFDPGATFPIPERRFGQPITEVVNGTFGVPAASSPRFWRGFAPIGRRTREFAELVRAYGVVLLTMIKIVLIAAISFASPSQ
jgi:hypothetical protein